MGLGCHDSCAPLDTRGRPSQRFPVGLTYKVLCSDLGPPLVTLPFLLALPLDEQGYWVASYVCCTIKSPLSLFRSPVSIYKNRG